MSISINVTPAASGGTFTVGSTSSQNVTLEVTGGIGPPGTDVALAAGTGISIVTVNNTATISSTVVIPDNLADLSDVTLGNVTSGQVLAYNGTAWTAAADNALTLSTSAGADLGTAAIGTSGEAARADHVHNLPTFAEITNGTATVTGNLTLDASTGSVTFNGGTAGSASLTLNCEQNTHGVTIQGPPHSAAATYTLTLPTSDGAANQVLQTDGSGSLSWANQSAGGVTWATEPAASNSTGTAGQIAYGSGFFYLHDGTEWRRAALSTFGTSTPTITITTQPQDLTLADGGSGNFTIAATVSDGSTPTYQWQNSDDSGATWDTLTGSIGTTYSLSGVSTLDNGTQYRAIVSAAGASDVTSSVATLTVTAAATYDLLAENGDRLMTEAGDSLDHDGTGSGATLSFSTQPTNQTVENTISLSTATFTATAVHSSGSAVSYQWQRDEREATGNWQDLSGETSSTLDFSPYQGDSQARFRCVATAGGLTVTSSVAVLTVSTLQLPTMPAGDGFAGGEEGFVRQFHETVTASSINVETPTDSAGTYELLDAGGTSLSVSGETLKRLELYKDGVSVKTGNNLFTGKIIYNGSDYEFEEVGGSSLTGAALPSGEYRVVAQMRIDTLDGLTTVSSNIEFSTRVFSV